MTNQVQPGNALDVVLTGPVLSGGVVVMSGTLCGVAATAGKTSDTVAVVVRGVFTLPKGNSAITQGTKLYWDAAANGGVGQVITTSTGQPVIGYAAAAAGAADTTVNVLLMPA